ncbi:wd40 repeat-containing protein [Leptolyngbya sp. Heron Island J]|nr:wd40 repeat-containing protein [Leptolyngbya sp. Heron Island J]
MLSSYMFVSAKLNTTGPQKLEFQDLINDYELAKPLFTKDNIARIQTALQLSADILKDDPSQLATQLWAQLCGHPSRTIQKLLNSAVKAQDTWLQPITPSRAINTGNGLYADHATLVRKSETIIALALTPDSKKVIAANAQGYLSAWNVETGNKLFDFGEAENVSCSHSGSILSLGILADEDYVMSVCDQSEVCFWDIGTGRRVLHRILPDRPIAFSISADGCFAVIGTSEVIKGFKIVKTGLPHEPFKFLVGRHQHIPYRGKGWGDLRSLAINSGGTLIQANFTETSVAFAFNSQGEIHPYFNHGLGQNSQFLFGKQILIFGGTNFISIQSMKSSREEPFVLHYADLALMSPLLYCIGLSPQDSYLAVGRPQGQIEIHEINTQQKLHAFNGHSDPIKAIAISSDGRHCISASDQNFRFWRLEPGQSLEIDISYTKGRITCVDVSPDAKYGLAASREEITIWSFEEGQLPQKYAVIPAFNMGKAYFNQSATKVIWQGSAPGYSMSAFHLWDIETKQNDSPVPVNEQDIIYDFVITGDGKSIITYVEGRSDQQIVIRDITSQHNGFRLFQGPHNISTCTPYFGEKIKGISAIPNSPNFFTWTLGGKEIRYWTLNNKRITYQILNPQTTSHRYTVLSASSYKQSLIAARIEEDQSNTVEIWEYDSHHQSYEQRYLFNSNHQPAFHKDMVKGVSLSSDGQMLITSSSDCTVCVWDTRTKELLAKFVGDQSFETCFLSSDDRTIFVGDYAGAKHLLRLNRDRTL